MGAATLPHNGVLQDGTSPAACSPTLLVLSMELKFTLPFTQPAHFWQNFVVSVKLFQL